MTSVGPITGRTAESSLHPLQDDVAELGMNPQGFGDGPTHLRMLCRCLRHQARNVFIIMGSRRQEIRMDDDLPGPVGHAGIKPLRNRRLCDFHVGITDRVEIGPVPDNLGNMDKHGVGLLSAAPVVH